MGLWAVVAVSPVAAPRSRWHVAASTLAGLWAPRPDLLGRLARRAEDRLGTPAPVLAYLGLGSNLGDRLATLQQAVDRLHALPGVAIDQVSAVYETDPVGGTEQPDYYNVALRVLTTRSPSRLLAACHQVEQALGRVRTVRWGPRTIDVDILLYDQRVVGSDELVIPHPRLTVRPFALVPLAEVAPGGRLPDGRSLVTVLASLAPIEGITAIGRQVRRPGGAE